MAWSQIKIFRFTGKDSKIIKRKRDHIDESFVIATEVVKMTTFGINQCRKFRQYDGISFQGI